MNILGIYPATIGHDSNAALVKDGKLVAAVEEERFVREKHTNHPPTNSVKFCLEQAKLSLEDIDFITVPLLPYKFARRSLTELFQTAGRFALHHSRPSRFWYDTFIAPPLKKKFSDVKADIRYYEHHLAHAATAFYCSGFKRASLLTVDGAGELNSTVLWKGEPDHIKKIREESSTNSLGGFYETVTYYLNLGWWGEGKTMGLAPYGRPNKNMTAKIERHLDTSGQLYKRKIAWPKQEILGFPPRKDGNILTRNYTDFAFAAQEALERAMLKCVEYLVRRTDIKELGMSGGVALNCTANSKIAESGLVDDMFIFPACNDGGASIGSALECARQNGEKVNFKLEHAYYGPGYSDDQIEATLKADRITYEKHGDIAGTVAELLAKGKIVGWFQGRMEIGPRALGNRSILADPRKKETWNIVNKVKGREMWRPLAPSLLNEAKEEYFENARESPFMLLTFKVREEKQKEVPAIVHVDGTTRPQTVRKEVNERYYRCIKEFGNITGEPMVLNTSFNVAKEPIVCSPSDAIRTFYSSSLDCLALGSFLLRKD